ncbi:MAG: hypothetical protein ACREDE_05680, partial [Thermoplasmata archaeon]
MRGVGGPVRACPFLLAASGALLAALLLASSVNPAVLPSRLGIGERPTPSAPQLTVDPPTWWMAAGNVSPMRASWVASAPGCVLSPVWYRWSVEGAAEEGWLDPTAGPAVNFTAAFDRSGVAEVVVRSAVALSCGAESSAVVATAVANVTVALPISIQNLSVGPNPVPLSESTNLTGNLSGGEPPYTLHATWSDGDRSLLTTDAPGPFRLSHIFPPGNYSPSLSVTDSVGLSADESWIGNVEVGAGFVVGVTANRTQTDVNLPVGFNATVLHAPPGASLGWTCGSGWGSGAVTSLPAPSVDFSCWFPQPGLGEATVEVTTPGGWSPNTARLAAMVEPSLALVAR